MYLGKNCNILSLICLMAIFIFPAIQWTYQPLLAWGADQGMQYMDSDCHALKLKTATGIPQGEIHKYEFLGTCNINSLQETGPKVEKIVPAIGSAVWDSSKMELKEFFNILGNTQFTAHIQRGNTGYNPIVSINDGMVTSTFKCNADPLISNATCLTTDHSNNSGFPPFSNPAHKNRPLLKGKTTLTEASALSEESTPPPALPSYQTPETPSLTKDIPPGSDASQTQITPQPPTVSQPVSKRAGGAAAGEMAGKSAPSPAAQRTADPQQTQDTTRTMPDAQVESQASSTMRSSAAPMLLNVEGEDLAKGGKILLAGGQVTSQSMGSFGTGWSGDEQLFWSGGSVGAVLDLLVDIPVAATYALELYPTRAPDYGMFKIQVDGQDAPVTVDGYSPRVMQPAPRQIGKFSLDQGEHRISFMVMGKNPMSTGYLVGIDRLRLYPVGPFPGNR